MPKVRTVRRAARAGAVCVTTVGGLGSGHLLMLLGAVVYGRTKAPPPPCDTVSLAVLIPAHDEEAQLAATIRSLQDTEYDPDRRRVIVIADNCTDRTAAVARAAGAEVWERSDTLHRGKGHALAWAFARVLED